MLSAVRVFAQLFLRTIPKVFVGTVMVSGGLLFAGCASMSITKSDQAGPVYAHQRDVLATAAAAVADTPWQRPATRSLMGRLMGGARGSITSQEAVMGYATSLEPAGARFSRLIGDAKQNLAAASMLVSVADNVIGAARPSMDDVAVIEDAIQIMRANKTIVSETSAYLVDDGEAVNDTELLASVLQEYSVAIRQLGKKADALADVASGPTLDNYAEPQKYPLRSQLTDS